MITINITMANKLIYRNRLTDLENELNGYQRGRVEGRDRLGVSDWQVHTAIFEIKCLSMKKVGPLDKTGPLTRHFHLLKKKKKLKSSKQMYLVLPAVKRDEQQQSSPIFSKSLPQRVSQAPTLYVNWGSRTGLGGWKEVILSIADCRRKQQFYDSMMKGHLPQHCPFTGQTTWPLNWYSYF